tara:strand:+ start:2659 stop:2901 length:243 start_codon:yes stop_codon:yes gene_type:complete
MRLRIVELDRETEIDIRLTIQLKKSMSILITLQNIYGHSARGFISNDIETEIVEFEIFKYIMITTSTYTEEVQDKFYQFI